MSEDHTRPGVRIGDVAPNFLARSTQGPFELADLRGKWVVLFSHPADFTPVCTSEFLAFAQAEGGFAELGVQLVGFSVDSLFSHFAWLRAIRDEFGVEVTFPVIEDPTMVIAHAYGMVPRDAGDASAVRATYVIDPDGVVRAMFAYPTSVGRSVPEVLRLVTALQATWRNGQLAPANWEAGGALLRVPSTEIADVLGSEGATGWFFRGPAADSFRKGGNS